MPLGDGGLGQYYGVGNGASRLSVAIEGEMALAAWGERSRLQPVAAAGTTRP